MMRAIGKFVGVYTPVFLLAGPIFMAAFSHGHLGHLIGGIMLGGGLIGLYYKIDLK